MDKKRYGKGFPGASNYTPVVKASSESNGICKAITESGSECKETRSLKIINEIHELYADRLQKIDDETGGEGTQLKIKMLQSWVNDLGEQNAMLVRTVEKLEQEAAERVTLLEDSLQRSSRVAMEYMKKLQDYDNQMNEVTGAKVDSEAHELKMLSQVKRAKEVEGELHGRVENLQNDIAALLELIRRARQTGNWSLWGLVFKEVTPEDIFGQSPYEVGVSHSKGTDEKNNNITVSVELPDPIQPHLCACDMGLPPCAPALWVPEPPITLSEKDEEIKKLRAEIQELQKHRDRVKAECDQKDRSIADMQTQIKKLQDDVVTKDSQIKGFIQRIQELRDSIAQKSDQAADLLELAARFDASMVTESSDSAEARRYELEAAMWKRRVADSEAELLQARTELRQVENDAFQQQSEIINVTHKLNESEHLLQGAIRERTELTKQVASLSAQLNAKTEEIVALTRSLAETEKSAKDMREALTAEVAEKHDQLLALRRDVMQLEEQCRQADMQTHFKDDIIKEMRKDVKLARSKLAILEEVVKDQGYSGDIGQRLLALNELGYSLPTKSVSYDHQDRFPSASFAYDPNFHSERVAQVLPYQRVSDGTKYSRSHQYFAEKTRHAADLHSAVEKTHRHSNSLRHNLSHDKLPRTRTKSTRTQSQLIRVEEALKQELSKLNNKASCRDVEVVESTTSTRTIGVQYSQQKQARVDPKDLEAKERRVIELENALKNIKQDLQKQWEEKQNSIRTERSSKSADQFRILKEQLEVMVNNLKDRDDKITRQNVMIEELESRLEYIREDLMQLHTRAEGYLKQMTATQKSHDESQRRISELKETLDTTRQSMTGSLSKLQTSVDNKDLKKSMGNVLDYQHKAEECQATLTAMKGEIDYLMHNMQSREKQIKNLEETIRNLKESLGTAKGEMEKAHRMAMAYLKEKEMVEATQKNYEKSIEDLKRALLACQEEKARSEAKEILPDDVEKINDLLKQDDTTTKSLIEAINALLDALRRGSKTEDHALETRKKSSVKFAEKSPEDYEFQIKELQRQLKEAQAKNAAVPEGGSKPTPPAAILLAREVEEYRIKTVEAQAALEELKDVIDSLHENIQSRENQVSDLEKMMTALLDTLFSAQKDMSILQEKFEHYEKMKKVNDFVSNPDGDVSQRKMQPSLDSSCGEMYDPCSALTTSDELKPDMEECWICLQKSLNKAFIEIRNIWARAEDYAKQKQEFEVNRSYNEQKLEKLHLELESTQEDLKNTVIELHDSVLYQHSSVHSKSSLPAVASRVSIVKSLVNYQGKDMEATVAIAKMKDEIDTLLKELDLRDQQIARQEEQLITVREALSKSQQELSEVKRTAALEKDQFAITYGECERKVKALQQELKAAEDQIKMYKSKSLQESQESLPRKTPSDNEKDERIKELEEMLMNCEQELEEFKERAMQDSEEDLPKLTSESSKDRRIKELEEMLQSSERQLQVYKELARQESQEALPRKVRSDSSKDHKIRELEEMLKRSERELQVFKAKFMEESEEALPRKDTTDSSKDCRIKELEEIVKNLNQELQACKDSAVQKRTSTNQDKSDTADYDGTDEDAKRYIKELKEEITRLAAQLDSSIVEAMKHAEANKALKENLRHTLDEMQNLRKDQMKQDVGEQSNEQKVKYLEEELKVAQEEMRLFRDRLLQESQVPPPQTDLQKWKATVSEIVDYRSKDPEANRIITCLEEEMDSLLDALQVRDNKVAALYDQLSRLRQEQFQAQNELQKMKRQAKLEQIQKQLQSDYDKELKIQELEDNLEYMKQELNLYKGRVEGAENISDKKPVVEPVRSFVAEAVDYRGKDQESHTTINNLKTEIARLLDELNLKNEQIAKEKEINTTMQEQLNQTKNAKQELENKTKLKETDEQLKNQILKEKIKRMEDELKTAEDEINIYREGLTKTPEVEGKKQTLPEVKSYITGIIDYRGKDEEANRNIADLKAEVARLLNELNSSNIEVSEQEKINSTLMEELNHLKSDYLRLKKDMQSKQTQNKLELQKYEEKVADLECDLKAALEQVKTYRLKQIERSETRMKSEKSFVAESVNYQGKDGEASKKIASLKAEIDKLVNELNDRNNEIVTQEAMNKTLQGELHQALDDLSELKQQVREKRIKEESGLSYEQKIAELQKDLQDAKEEIVNYREKIEKAQTAKTPAIEPMKSFVADSIDYRGEDTEARRHIDSLKNEISNLLDELNTRNAQFATKEDVNKSLRDQLSHIREENKALEREARLQTEQLQLGITSNELQINNLQEDLKFAQDQIKIFRDSLLQPKMEAVQEQPSAELISRVTEAVDYSGSDEEAKRNILDLKTEIDRLLGHLNLSNAQAATQHELNKNLQTELASIKNELQMLKEELRRQDSSQQSKEVQEQQYKELLLKVAAAEEELRNYREQHKQQSEVSTQKPLVALKRSSCLQAPSHVCKDEEASKRISALQKEMKSLLGEIYSRDAQIAALICQIDVLQGQPPHQHLEFLNEVQEPGSENVTGVTQTMDSQDKDMQILKLQRDLDAAQKQIDELIAQKHVPRRSSSLLARSPNIRQEPYTGKDEGAKSMIKKLQEEIDNLTKELESRDAQNQLQEKTIDSLRSSLLLAQTGIEELKRLKDAAEEKAASLQNKLNDLERESGRSSDRSSSLQKKIEDLEAELADANEIKKVQQLTIDSLRKSLEDSEMEIETLRKSRRPSESYVKVLQDTVEDLRNQLAKQSEAKKYHMQTIDSLRKALDEKQIKQSKSEDDALRKELAKCQETINSLKETVQSQKNVIETLKEKEIQSIIPNEESDLKKRLTHRKSVVIEDPKTNTVHELEDRVKWLEKELGIRESMLKRQASDPSKDILKDRVGYLTEELRRKSASSLPSENELLKEQRAIIEKLETTVLARDEQIEKLNDEILQLSQQQLQHSSGHSSRRSTMTRTISFDEQNIEKLKERIKSLEQELADCQTKHKSLSFEDLNMEKLKDRVQSLEKELADCQTKIDKHRDDHSGEELKKEIRDLEKKLTARDSVIKQYKEDKDRLDRKLVDLERQLSDISKYKDDQKNQNERLLELEKQLAVREALIKEHKEDKEKLNTKLKDLENELAVCRASIKEHKENMERLTEKQKGLEKELAESKALLKKYEGSPSVHELQHKVDSLKKQLHASASSLHKYEGGPSVDDLQDKVKDLKQELSARDKMIEDLREKVRSLQKKLNEQEDAAKRPVRTASCEKMIGELDVLRKELALHAQMNASQVKIIENLQLSNSDTQAELKALQSKSSELEKSRKSNTNQIVEQCKLQLQLTQDKLEEQVKENEQQAETIALLQSSLQTAKTNLAEAEEGAREADRKLRRANEEQMSTNEKNKEIIEVLEGKVTAREAEVKLLEEKVDLLKDALEQEQQRVINKIKEADNKEGTNRAAALEICREKLASTEELLEMKTRENMHQAHMIEVLQRGNAEAIQLKEKAEEKAREVENNCYKKLEECETTVRGLKDENEILQQRLKELQEALAESKRDAELLHKKTEEYAKQFKDLAYCKTKLGELEMLVDSQEKEIADKDAANEKLKENLKAIQSELALYKGNLQNSMTQLGAMARKAEEQQDELERLKREVNTLQSALKAKEKVTKDQREELQIQQETLAMAQNELKELQKKLKDVEKLQDEQEKMEYQQATISHLQHALLSTKHQLEELQGKGSFELKIKDCIIKVLHLDLTEIETQYRDCYGEVVKREKSLETLRDANVDLSVQAFYLQQDVGILQFRLADYLHSLRITKGQFEAVKNENERLKAQIEELKYEISNLQDQLSEEEEAKQGKKGDAKIAEEYEELKKENDTLKEEIERLKEEVEEEAEQNKNNSARLLKLEGMLKVQALEMQRNEELNRLLKLKYEDVVKKNKEMENELTSLNSQVMNFQHQLDLSEERSDTLQRELDACKETLGHVKEKTESLKELLKEKTNQVTDLTKDCAATRDNMQSLNNEAMMLASDARCEVEALKHKVQNLQRSLEVANANYQRVGEDARRHQAQLLDSANREIQLQMEFTTKENFLMEKLHKSQAENSKMSDVVDLLNRDNQELRTELSEREGQLQATANKLQNLVQDTAKLQKEMESKNNTMKKLEGGLSRSNLKLMQALNHIENKDKLLEDLKEELRATQAENKKLHERIQGDKLQEQAQNDELQQKVHVLQLAAMDAKDQFSEAQEKLKEYAAANNQLKATCKNLETENARLQEQLQGDKARDNKLQEQVKLLQLAAMSAKDKSNEAQQQLREFAAQNSQLAAKCKELENELDNLQDAFQQKEAIANQLMNERQNMVKNSSELRHINVALRQALRSSRRRETKLLDWPLPSTSQSYYLDEVSPPAVLTQETESAYWVMSKSSTSLWHNEDENVKKNNLYWKRKLRNTDYYDDTKEIGYQSSSSK